MRLIPTLALMGQVHAAPIDPRPTTTNTSPLYEVSSHASHCNDINNCRTLERFHARVHLNPWSAPRPSVHRIDNSKNLELSSRDCSRTTLNTSYWAQRTRSGCLDRHAKMCAFAVMLSTQSHSLLPSCLLVDHHSPTRRVNSILGQIASEVPHFNGTLQVHSALPV